MAWYDTKQAAVDPDNPAANEQFPFSEHNAMVAYQKDKINNKTVDLTGLLDDMIMVYDLAGDKFVFEAKSTVGALNDLTDVVISGVPADNEVVAYDTATSKFINQTAAEAGLATVAGLASYLALAGGTMAGNLNMGDHQISNVDDMQANDAVGMHCRDSASGAKMTLASTTYAFVAYADANLNTHKLINVVDPTAAQDASTKNYADTRLFTKEAVTAFTDGYVPVYRTSSGKFEMEAGGGSAGLPVVDTTNIIKGSADGTKLVRFEVDGLTTGTTRVLTVPDKNLTLCDVSEAMLLSGTQAMTADMDLGGFDVSNVAAVYGISDTGYVAFQGTSAASGSIWVYGKSHATQPGRIRFIVPNAGGLAAADGGHFEGITNTPKLYLDHGLDMNNNAITDIKNSAPTALSGTQKDIEIDIGGVAYYFTVYPTKA